MQNCGMATSFVTWAESWSTQKDRIWVKTYFFIFYAWYSCNFGPKTRLILSEDLFLSIFFGLHLILGRKTDWFSVEKFFFGLHYFRISCPPPFRKSCVRYCPAARGFGGLGAKPLAVGRFFVSFLEKTAILMPLNHISYMFRIIWKH